MDGLLGDWNAVGPPDVLPQGYGDYSVLRAPSQESSTPFDRGHYNIAPPGNLPVAPGWYTAGLEGTHGGYGDYGAAKRPAQKTLADGTIVQQYPDDSFIVLSSVNPNFSRVAGKPVTQATHPREWAALKGMAGAYQPPTLTALARTATALIEAAGPPAKTLPAKMKRSKVAVTPEQAALVTGEAPGPTVPVWVWIAGGVAVLGVLGVTLMAATKKKG